jgi:hypothetical protein
VARPRKFGPTISFRLPVDLHQVIVERAEANGETVNAYVERKITEAATTRLKPLGKPDGTRSHQVTPVWKESMKK